MRNTTMHFKDADKKRMIARYIGGYVDHPETPDEVAAAEASATALFAEEPWA